MNAANPPCEKKETERTKYPLFMEGPPPTQTVVRSPRQSNGNKDRHIGHSKRHCGGGGHHPKNERDRQSSFLDVRDCTPIHYWEERYPEGRIASVRWTGRKSKVSIGRPGLFVRIFILLPTAPFPLVGLRSTDRFTKGAKVLVNEGREGRSIVAFEFAMVNIVILIRMESILETGVPSSRCQGQMIEGVQEDERGEPWKEERRGEHIREIVKMLDRVHGETTERFWIRVAVVERMYILV
mmetsp:Transcript_31254/g.76250  ORF Transcript_31254/g.76250 Transcript_31254/m.76250 type:complete len:239 (-) Transcript_31254:675-1391(-)